MESPTERGGEPNGRLTSGVSCRAARVSQVSGPSITGAPEPRHTGPDACLMARTGGPDRPPDPQRFGAPRGALVRSLGVRPATTRRCVPALRRSSRWPQRCNALPRRAPKDGPYSAISRPLSPTSSAASRSSIAALSSLSRLYRRCGLDPAANGREPGSARPSGALHFGGATAICVFASITQTTFSSSLAWPSRLKTVIIRARAMRGHHAKCMKVKPCAMALPGACVAAQ